MVRIWAGCMRGKENPRPEAGANEIITNNLSCFPLTLHIPPEVLSFEEYPLPFHTPHECRQPICRATIFASAEELVFDISKIFPFTKTTYASWFWEDDHKLSRAWIPIRSFQAPCSNHLPFRIYSQSKNTAHSIIRFVDFISKGLLGIVLDQRVSCYYYSTFIFEINNSFGENFSNDGWKSIMLSRRFRPGQA